jgi:formate-dependent nitrite reductase membrane component NrfD
MNAAVELASTRHNPGVDPVLAGWTWEIPVYLFVGGAVAGLMIMGGIALVRAARGADTRGYAAWQAPLLGFAMLNVGMLALLLDLAHRWYAWRVFLTLQPSAPMSWGSWTLLLVYGVLLVSMLVRLPSSWPWLAARLPLLRRASDALTASPRRLAALGIANVALGLSLGTYTGLLLSTMVARPLWNSAALPLLFLLSGLCAGSALLMLGAWLRGEGAAPSGALGGALATLVQPVGGIAPPRAALRELVRTNVGFIVGELVLIGLFAANLATSTASHAQALALLTSGPFAAGFWGIDIALGLLLPLAVQALLLAQRSPALLLRWLPLPALLVVAGSFTLRWVMVNAGQMSRLVAAGP